jgi:uncharacterized protein (TIGR00251 family)
MARLSDDTPFRIDGTDLVLRLKVLPGARHTGFEGLVEDAGGRLLMKLKVRAKALDGAANVAVVAAVAEAFGCPRYAVAIESGRTARMKTLRIAGGAGAAQRAEELSRP